MSVRVITAFGLICLTMAVAMMYVPFIDLYARAEADASAQVPPFTASAFVWPTELPSVRGRLVLVSVMFAAAAGLCMTALAFRVGPEEMDQPEQTDQTEPT